jgi:hypothetical protein
MFHLKHNLVLYFLPISLTVPNRFEEKNGFDSSMTMTNACFNDQGDIVDNPIPESTISPPSGSKNLANGLA